MLRGMSPMRFVSTLVASAAVVFSLAGCASQQASMTSNDPAMANAKPYPLKTCIVMDDKLDKKPYVFVYQGQQIKLCCEGCKEDFDKNPQKYLDKLAAK
jgi:YHS domain-containing protein